MVHKMVAVLRDVTTADFFFKWANKPQINELTKGTLRKARPLPGQTPCVLCTD